MSNDRIPLSPPVIAALDRGEAGPLWSVMIPVYNCSQYLPKLLETVLGQDPGPGLMQIEVVDDCSTDADVQEIVETIGGGRIGYYRQMENVGSLRNFEACLNRSKGKWIHLLHGDDFVSPGFYDEIRLLFENYPEAGAAFTGFHYVDESSVVLYPNRVLAEKPGYIDNWLDIISQTQCIQPPAMVVKRSVYEELGAFFGVHYGEDWEMWVRISYRFPIVHSPVALANYRIHKANITSRYFLSGQNIRDIRKVIGLIQHYLPEDKRNRLRRLANRNFSIYFAKTSDMVYHGYKQRWQAFQQAVAALRMDVNPTTFYFAAKLFVKILIRYRSKQERLSAAVSCSGN
ncbi:MAG TPA: glycosyltransferase [Puia sp.]|jgi:glycosyltransferase involved in cell wall biosynthesis